MLHVVDQMTRADRLVLQSLVLSSLGPGSNRSGNPPTLGLPGWVSGGGCFVYLVTIVITTTYYIGQTRTE